MSTRRESKQYKTQEIWQGTGIELYEVGRPSNSVGVERKSIASLISRLKDPVSGGIGRLYINVSSRTVVLTDHQGRRLSIPRKSLSMAIEALKWKASNPSRVLAIANPMRYKKKGIGLLGIAIAAVVGYLMWRKLGEPVPLPPE